MKCVNCERTGHYALDCRTAVRDHHRQQNMSVKSGESDKRGYKDYNKNDSKTSPGKACVVFDHRSKEVKVSAAEFSNSKRNNIMDSGASEQWLIGCSI